MSEPNIPKRTTEQSINDLLHSVALEEASLAHLINAEAEKIQASLEQYCQEDILQVQESVQEVFNKALKMQILLEFKLEEIKNLKEENENDCSNEEENE